MEGTGHRYLIFKAESKQEAEKFENLTSGKANLGWQIFNRKENSFYYCINWQSDDQIKQFKNKLQEEVIAPNNIEGEILIEKPKINTKNKALC